MDITNVKLLYVKGLLLLACGFLAAGAILLEHPSWKLAAPLGAAIWCFAPAYTFAFYVIEHYVDPSYRFAGLTSFVRYALSRRKRE